MANLSALAPVSAVIYTRVSTGKQAASGLGQEAQLAACRALAERRGYRVVGEFEDEAISGKDAIDRRPGLQARPRRAAGKREDVVVIVYSLSRLCRCQSSHLGPPGRSGGVPSPRGVRAPEPFDTVSPMGRAMLGMLWVWSQLEADMCAERTSAALQARRARGLRLGPRPLAGQDPATVRLVQELYGSARPGSGADGRTARIAEEL